MMRNSLAFIKYRINELCRTREITEYELQNPNDKLERINKDSPTETIEAIFTFLEEQGFSFVGQVHIPAQLESIEGHDLYWSLDGLVYTVNIEVHSDPKKIVRIFIASYWNLIAFDLNDEGILNDFITPSGMGVEVSPSYPNAPQMGELQPFRHANSLMVNRWLGRDISFFTVEREMRLKHGNQDWNFENARFYNHRHGIVNPVFNDAGYIIVSSVFPKLGDIIPDNVKVFGSDTAKAETLNMDYS